MSGSIHKYQVLYLDDEIEYRRILIMSFGDQFDVTMAKDIEQMEYYLDSGRRFDLMLLDLELEKGSGDLVGLKLIRPIQKKRPGLPIIVITKDENATTARKAEDEGAETFLIKGQNEKNWPNTFIKAIGKGISERSQLRQTHFNKLEGSFAFVGESEQVKEIRSLLEFVANSPATPLLILGETGTGKEVAARYMHSISPRKNMPFVTDNLAAIPETLLESTLFGHTKGAFTGAEQAREGMFKQANGGILMLDEIGDISESVQTKLLRFLNDKVIKPVGSDKEIKLDVQIIAATHRNLEEKVRKGTFREDLYMRLKSMSVVLPPLRERKSDISLLLRHFMGDPYDAIQSFTVDAWEKMMAYHWPGNIRQLHHAIAPMLYKHFTKGNGNHLIDLECLPDEVLKGNMVPVVATADFSPFDDQTITTVSTKAPQAFTQFASDNHTPRLEALAHLNLQYIENALKEKNKVKQDAAKMLNYKSADSLLYDIKGAFRDFPHLFEENDFKHIKAAYPQIFK